MTPPVHPIIRRYAGGEMSASQAAGLLGGRSTVADVLVMLKQAWLEPPRQPADQARAELAGARVILGLPPRPG